MRNKIARLLIHFGLRVLAEKVETLTYKNGDIIVLSCNQIFNQSERGHISKQMTRVFPNSKIIVLDQGTTMQVIRPE